MFLYFTIALLTIPKFFIPVQTEFWNNFTTAFAFAVAVFVYPNCFHSCITSRMKAAVRNVTKPDIDTNIKTGAQKGNRYFFTRAEVQAGGGMTSVLRASIPGTDGNFYAMRKWKFERLSTSTHTWEDVTDKINRSDSSIWAAQGQSGYNINTAISLIDKYGILLSLTGTDENLSVDNITWDSLLEALNHNKTVDILGKVLKGLKINLTDSGNNYLEFANGLRVYFSKTEPAGDDIPDGSIGIGW